MNHSIKIFFIVGCTCLTNLLFAQHNMSINSFVDGIIVTPFYTGRTIAENQLQIGTSVFYYQHSNSQNNSLYYPFQISDMNEDALLNYSIQYGLTDKTEIAIYIPVAPDWRPNYGSDRIGIADITLFLKYNLYNYKNIQNGLLFAGKLNTSTYPDILNWYGTDNNNIFVIYIMSYSTNKVTTFMNFGFKYVLGETKRPAFDYYDSYEYSNTVLAAAGIQLKFINWLQVLLETNYESANKKNISGYYLDFCLGAVIPVYKNFKLYVKSGKNMNNFTPYIHITSGISMTFSL